MEGGRRREAGGPFLCYVPFRISPPYLPIRVSRWLTLPHAAARFVWPGCRGSLKFSTGGDYFNACSTRFADMSSRSGGICKKKRLLQIGACTAGLATALHIASATPARANQKRGNKNGKENLEEGKEDRSDEAVDGSGPLALSTDCDTLRLTLLQERGAWVLQCFSLEKG